MAKVKITVVKRDLYTDLVEKYAKNPAGMTACGLFSDNQEFLLERANMPEGFCSWAWADIQRDVVSVFNGASYPWIKENSAIVSCCTDGLRPVTFLIQKTED